MAIIGILSRRDLLRGGTSAASILVAGMPFTAPGHASTSPTLEQFFDLSRTLTGQSSLDNGMGGNILDAFVSAGQAEDLATLIADSAPERSQSKIADAVVAAWYSGASPLTGAREVTGFNEALVWNALSYTKPWGNCGGEMGYWSELPAGEEP